MSKSESNQNFDTWLSTGLQGPMAADSVFVQRMLERLEIQEGERLLKQIRLQKRILGWLTVVLIAAGLGAIFLSPVSTEIYAFLQMLMVRLIQLILHPTLAGLVIPGVVLILAGVVLWNLIEIVSLE